MSPLVSVIIPCYNARKWLAGTLESVLGQTQQNIEIILVDDGSSDGSLDLARSFKPRGIQVLSQTHKGASAARNRGFIESRGSFIQFLDADDILAPDKIALQIGLLSLEENKDHIASGEYARFIHSPEEARFIPEPVWVDMLPVDWCVRSWEGGGMMANMAYLVPRHIAEYAGPWNEKLSLDDDGEYFCRVRLASKGILFCRGAKSYYRVGLRHSLNSLQSRAAFISLFRSYELCTHHLLDVENSPRTRHACSRLFQYFIYDTYPNVPDFCKKAEEKVKEFGGDLDWEYCSGGFLFRSLSYILGWKIAKIVKNILYRLGYKRIALGRIFLHRKD